MTTILRTAYQGLLWLHPSDFREEFGKDMLWIFDEECKNGNARTLFFDGLRSTIVQNTLRPQTVNAEAVGGIYVEIDSTIPAERIVQKWLIALSCTLSLTLFMSMMVPCVAMPLGRLLYSSIHRDSPSPTVSYSSTLWKHRR